MVYNPPPSGHVLLVLDDGVPTVAGRQDQPASDAPPARRTTGISIEDLARSCGVKAVDVVDPADPGALERLLRERLAAREPAVVVARRACPLPPGDPLRRERAAAAERCLRGEGP
jgi:indolepyruvate ferredoxin oxidoreductase alpha subunit